MIFIWTQSGIAREVEFGSNIRGMHKWYKRPNLVVLDDWERNQILTDEKAKEYYETQVKTRLMIGDCFIIALDGRRGR